MQYNLKSFNRIEEKLNSLAVTIGEMEKSMSLLVNDNIDFLDKHILSTFEQIFERKIQSIDQGLKNKLSK